ncbi:MAG: biotin/lipoyl-binding protein [Chloroflexi bacterium]|nr:biotin/lipoyl-binding protein [Chloroflexota bacterium]
MSIKYIAEIEGNEYQIEILSENRVVINDVPHEINFHALRQFLSYSLLVDGKSYETNIYQDNGDWEVLLRGRQFQVQVEDERDRRLRMAAGQTSRPKGKFTLQAPMPGMVIEIPVAVGDEVEEGDVLVILESMKMQNELTAPRAGKVTKVQAKINGNVERKETLLILE